MGQEGLAPEQQEDDKMKGRVQLITGREYISPGKGLQTYKVVAFDDTSVVVWIKGHSGKEHLTTYARPQFEAYIQENNI